MNRTNKKAVSAVVATVLIIMITVAAVGIIWAAIIPMVRDSLSKGTVCNDALSDISIGVEGYTCIESDGNISLQIKKGSNANVKLVAVNALIFEGGSSTSVRINATNVYDGTTSNISGNLPGNNVEQVIILSGDYTDATSIKIAPVVTVGKTEETCAATQEVALGPCN